MTPETEARVLETIGKVNGFIETFGVNYGEPLRDTIKTVGIIGGKVQGIEQTHNNGGCSGLKEIKTALNAAGVALTPKAATQTITVNTSDDIKTSILGVVGKLIMKYLPHILLTIGGTGFGAALVKFFKM